MAELVPQLNAVETAENQVTRTNGTAELPGLVELVADRNAYRLGNGASPFDNKGASQAVDGERKMGPVPTFPETPMVVPGGQPFPTPGLGTNTGRGLGATTERDGRIAYPDLTAPKGAPPFAPELPKDGRSGYFNEKGTFVDTSTAGFIGFAIGAPPILAAGGDLLLHQGKRFPMTRAVGRGYLAIGAFAVEQGINLTRWAVPRLLNHGANAVRAARNSIR